MLGHSISSRRPDLDIREPDNVVAALEGTTHPRVLVTSNYGWEDRYIDSLSSGDWVSTVGAGYDNFPLTTFAEANITFTNVCHGVIAYTQPVDVP
jgi:phosphoglycerate dehydrogenase-like enzyme